MFRFDHLKFSGAHIVLKDDDRTDFIDQCLVLARLLAQSAVKHGLMSQDRSEAFVVVFDGNARHGFTPAVDKLLNTLQILTGLAVGLARLADDDALDRFTRYVLAQVFKQLSCSNSFQPACN